jgi:hypothetical protein
MASDQVTIDLTYGKNALFVRQTVAAAFGIAINRELTWEMIRETLSDPSNRTLPARIMVKGLPHLGTTVPHEADQLRSVLRELGALRPDIAIRILIHT